jgi:4-hydroxy-3-methylbut-2-en-1-yl diphosphate reductase
MKVMTSTESVPPRGRVLVAKPRGYCAGVDRAVQTVEHALEH